MLAVIGGFVALGEILSSFISTFEISNVIDLYKINLSQISRRISNTQDYKVRDIE